jgi:hypothetical protein
VALQVRVEVGEPSRVQAGERALADDFPRRAKERADQRRLGWLWMGDHP